MASRRTILPLSRICSLRCLQGLRWQMNAAPRLFVLAYASKKVRVVLAFAICCKREQQRGEDRAMSERRTLLQHARYLCDSGPFFCPHIQACLLSGQCSGRVLALCLCFFLSLAIPRENSSAFSRSLNRSAALPRMPAVTFREQPLWHKAYCHALQEVAWLQGHCSCRSRLHR